MKLVKYIGNADGSSTSRLDFRDDRPVLELGGMGEVTDEESAMLASRGIILEVVDDGGLDGLKVKQLQDMAAERGVDVEGLDKKDDLVSALRQNLATAPSSPEPVVAGGTSEGVATGNTGTSTSTGTAGAPA